MLFILGLDHSKDCCAFVPSKLTPSSDTNISRLPPFRGRSVSFLVLNSAALSSEDDENSATFFIPKEKSNPILRFSSDESEKIINGFGLWGLVATLVTGPIWSLAMYAVSALQKINPEFDKNHAIYDYTGKLWSRFWLMTIHSDPQITGETQLVQGSDEEKLVPALYVANHCSWLDIPMICTILDPVFKVRHKNHE